ncbi:MAG: hypothetical protein WED11_02165, partial [Natronospirillum sp.]
IRDNSAQPASVLVHQLMDVVNQGWSVNDTATDAAAMLTTEYPLQPFSDAYFNGTFATYAHEWELESHPVDMHPADLPPPEETPTLSLAVLEDFLRNPVRHYLKQRFKSRLYQDDLVNADDEPFGLDGLNNYLLSDRVLQQWQFAPDQPLDTWIDTLQADNRLPLHGFGERTRDALWQTIAPVVQRVETTLGDAIRRPNETLALAITVTLAGQKNLQLEDQLDQLYRLDGQLVQVILRPGAVRKDGRPRWDTLLRAWVRQLAANAQGTALKTVQFGSDSQVSLPALPPDVARQHLTDLVTHWQAGLLRPLPVLPKTALMWLHTEDTAKTRTAYEGGYASSGECSADIARYFPDFEHLADAGFTDWADKLYGPLLTLHQDGDTP